jgi:putative FmdB family regulatory protein
MIVAAAFLAIYEYFCTEHGGFDVRLAIGTAPDRHRCPTCNASARRAFSPPMVGSGSQSTAVLFGREECSSDSPELVAEVPPAVGTLAPLPHPALAHLPRP